MAQPGMEDFQEEAPKDSSQRPITEEGTPKDEGETIHIPTEFLQGTTFKEGDEVVLKVVAVDDEGIEVAYAKPEEAEPEAGGGDANAQIDQLNDGY